MSIVEVNRTISAGRLRMWSLLPIVMWYLSANAMAHYFTSSNAWSKFEPQAIVLYSLLSLYAIPWLVTIVTGFMVWGYALNTYGVVKGTLHALSLFVLQWLMVAVLTYFSIRWHYVYFYNPLVFV